MTDDAANAGNESAHLEHLRQWWARLSAENRSRTAELREGDEWPRGVPAPPLGLAGASFVQERGTVFRVSEVLARFLAAQRES